MGALRSLARATIWHPDAIDPDEWKYRSLKRVWLPIYDLIAIGAGIWATAFGSPILHRLFPEPVIDMAGILMALVAAVCLGGVIFPALWLVEMLGKTVLAGLLGAYAAAVLFFRSDPDPSTGFIVFILCLGIIPPFIRISILGEEWKERRDARRQRRDARRQEQEAH